MSDTENADRAGWARIALQAFANETRSLDADRNMSDPEAIDEALGDLLGNFRHLVGVDVFNRCNQRGLDYFLEEYEEENGEDGHWGHWGHCDTCGTLCDDEGCLQDRDHVAAIDRTSTFKVGSYVQTDSYGYRGRIYKIHGRCPEGAAWRMGQSDLTEQERAGKGIWYSILVHEGGAVVVPAGKLHLIEPFEFTHRYQDDYGL